MTRDELRHKVRKAYAGAAAESAAIESRPK